MVKNKTETIVTQVQPNQIEREVKKTSLNNQKKVFLIENSEGEVITSPMVGTFYAQPPRGKAIYFCRG
ncbi:MAG: hypothetical protein Ct9H300mP20_03530 [Gammaproteobacteria bacterium]|nr:MAG: hypothetical protein Ct9H300mP20_03530 [Gammaproteobacteria bacterium]